MLRRAHRPNQLVFRQHRKLLLLSKFIVPLLNYTFRNSLCYRQEEHIPNLTAFRPFSYFISSLSNIKRTCGQAISSVVEHYLDTVGVSSSSLLLPTNFYFLIRCLLRTLHFLKLLRRASNGAYIRRFYKTLRQSRSYQIKSFCSSNTSKS